MPVSSSSSSSDQSRHSLLPNKDECDIDLDERSTRRREGRSLLDFVAVFSLALVFTSIGIVAGYWFRAIESPLSVADFGINDNSPIPRAVFTTRHDVPFIPNKEWMGPREEADSNWASITAGSDSIFLHNPSQYGLSDPGIHAPFFLFNDPPAPAEKAGNLNNFYVLNSLHQLHCVRMVRMRYNELVYQSDATHPLSGSPIDDDWIVHLEHCFEYLRLSIMCGDYMTLEADSPPGSPEEYWKDGLSWGVVHSCIDWDGLMDFQEDQVTAYNGTWTYGHE